MEHPFYAIAGAICGCAIGALLMYGVIIPFLDRHF